MSGSEEEGPLTSTPRDDPASVTFESSSSYGSSPSTPPSDSWVTGSDASNSGEDNKNTTVVEGAEKVKEAAKAKIKKEGKNEPSSVPKEAGDGEQK